MAAHIPITQMASVESLSDLEMSFYIAKIEGKDVRARAMGNTFNSNLYAGRHGHVTAWMALTETSNSWGERSRTTRYIDIPSLFGSTAVQGYSALENYGVSLDFNQNPEGPMWTASLLSKDCTSWVSVKSSSMVRAGIMCIIKQHLGDQVASLIY